MAKRLQFCTALFLSASVFVTGCTVDVQDPNAVESDPSQSGAPPASTNTAPVIQLVGEPVITIPIDALFTDPGVVATDAEDGDLTSLVSSSSLQVDTSRPGQYEITYRVSDSKNLSAQPVKRTVIISAPVDEVPANQPVVQVPAITTVKLVGFTAAREMVELSTIENGSVIDLSETSIDLLNVVADSADVSKTGSVHFKLTGPISVDRWENNAMYTLVVDTINLSVSKSQLPVGDYTLVITPYSQPDMAGNKGATKTLSFKVVDKKIVSNVPKIAAVDLVSVTEGSGDYVAVTRITEGAEINLAEINTKLINVIAISEDVSKTGSVHFSLSGPVEINRAENNAAYALANETQHLDVSKNALPVGDYTLVVTPYAGVDAKGEAGIPLLVNFSVVGETKAPAVTPAPLAVADSYTFQLGSDAQPGQVKPVSVNDQFESEAVYEITKAPINGSARMFDMGFFTYSPNSGFSGTDTFTYQITQAGKTSSATVSLKVVAAEAPAAVTSGGFTAIKPSADSKLIYVSNSLGKDSNTCLSEAAPCKTISAGVEKMRSGYPDHLYLKRGDIWRDQSLNNLPSGRSAKEPAVIAFYGQSGNRPKIEVSQISYLHKKKIQFVHFLGFELSAYKLDPNNASFTGANGSNIMMLGDKEDLLFEDILFNYIEVVAQSWEGGVPKNLVFRRNIWTGYYYSKSSFDRNSRPSNMYMDGVDGLTIEENVFDHGGWHEKVPGAGANMFNHNIYLQHSVNGERVILRNNIITRASSHGAQLRAGGLAEDNFFGRNALGLLIGYSVEPLKTGVKAHAINNVASEGQSMIKGIDACTGAGLCTPAVWGIEFDINGAADWQAHGNIASSSSPDDKQWQTKYKNLTKRSLPGLDNPAAKSSNNIAWRWQSNDEGGSESAYPAPGRTLADYNQSLGGAHSFDEFMEKVKSRQLQQWDERYTAKSINQYIRAGFGR
jgi:hypothetical protein